MTDFSGTGLPIVPFLDTIADKLLKAGILVLEAEPGAGKTTLVPLSLSERQEFSDGKILVLEPRRLAAVSAAVRSAEFLGEPAGKRVGYRVRYETCISRATRIEFLTEALLTRIIQGNPGLEGIQAVVFDEFHERSIHADLGLALALECMQINPSLKILIMSATIDSARIANFCGGDRLKVPGRTFPVATDYWPVSEKTFFQDFAAGIVSLLGKMDGDILAFLPGMREMIQAEQRIKQRVPSAQIYKLHGSIPIEEQRRIISPKPSAERRIVLATNIAETSLTVPRVTMVADSGLARISEYQPRSGMDQLVTRRITQAQAEQRKGRAGRLSPGYCLRFWNASESLVSDTKAEILTTELSQTVLETTVWGIREREGLRWLDPPPESAWNTAKGLLMQLDMIDLQGRPLPKGKRALQSGLHPRLAAMLERGRESGTEATAAFIAALLQERSSGENRDIAEFAETVLRHLADKKRSGEYFGITREFDRLKRVMQFDQTVSDIHLGSVGTLLAAAFPDRVARRDKDGFYQFPSGRRAKLDGTFSNQTWIVAADMDAGETIGKIYSAAAISDEEAEKALAPSLKKESVYEWSNWKIDCFERISAGSIVLKERKIGKIPLELVTTAIHEKIEKYGFPSLPFDEEVMFFLSRLRYLIKERNLESAPDPSETALAAEVDSWLDPFVTSTSGTVVTEKTILDGLRFRYASILRELDRDCPEIFISPAGIKHRLVYPQDSLAFLEVKIQEMFGVKETPRVCGQPLVLKLLSPALRPLQVTRDLASFWQSVYREIRNPLKSRYPRHYWPENPLEAEPTKGTKPRNK